MVNPKGGNTEFADMRAAYETRLDDDTKTEIEDLICEHSLMYSRARSASELPTKKRDVKWALQRLGRRTHPVHRRSRYPSSHAGDIRA